ncbi:hypothetical protein [Rickettsiella endosymbiont of Aleochara curtula]|uniref:hypothetical protein n=1 Tax=Rickettsiella endosymbiont of Aleochara curtula TaxID=3077936 RepID=UPI00313C4A22
MFNNRVLKIFNSLVAMYICFFLAGCVSTIQMTPEEAKSIKTIEVSQKVIPAKKMYYLDQKQIWARACIGVFACAIPCYDAQQIKEAALKEKIQITEIVRNEFINQLKLNNRFKIANKEYSDATIYLEIRGYGLTIPTGFTDKLKPVLTVVGRLINHEGKVLWQDSESIRAFENLPDFEASELLQDPHNLFVAWNTAAQVVSKKLVKSLTS